MIAPYVYVSTTFVVLRWQHVMRQEGSHPDLRYESKMLKVAPQDNTTIDLLVFVEQRCFAFYDIHDHHTGTNGRTNQGDIFLRNLNIE